MFKYPNGLAMEIGDTVLLEHGRTSGCVELIVTTPDEMRAINVDEAGVMLISPPFGRVFLPHWSLTREPLQLVARAPKA